MMASENKCSTQNASKCFTDDRYLPCKCGDFPVTKFHKEFNLSVIECLNCNICVTYRLEHHENENFHLWNSLIKSIFSK